jgi:hypothetical protein
MSSSVSQPTRICLATPFAFLVVIPEGDLLLSRENIVISTEAAHRIIVSSAAERPPAFSVACFDF